MIDKLQELQYEEVIGLRVDGVNLILQSIMQKFTKKRIIMLIELRAWQGEEKNVGGVDKINLQQLDFKQPIQTDLMV